MTASYESFEKLASALQSLIVSLAVLASGVWTFYTFVIPQAQLNVTVHAKQENVEGCSPCIAALVDVTNTGRRNVFLDFGEPPLSVWKVVLQGDGSSKLGEGIRQTNYSWASRVLRSGETVQYPFFVRVPDAGPYLVQFSVPLPEVELRQHEKAGGPKGRIYWDGAAGVTVVRAREK
jgi:hypothetical protein